MINAARKFKQTLLKYGAGQRFLSNRYLPAKRFDILEDYSGFYRIPNYAPRTSGELAVPPEIFWEGYGTTAEEYLESGRKHIATMLEVLKEAGAPSDQFTRVLEFGCAAARMLRFVPYQEGISEFWGAEIQSRMIEWCQRHLSPRMRFVATTTFPHLPFEDNHFNLIFAGSVFTHISDLPDAWFLELLRTTAPGGYLYLTIHDKHSVELVLGGGAKFHPWFRDAILGIDAKKKVLASDYGAFAFESGNWFGAPCPQVFYDIDYLRQRWGAYAPLVAVRQEAYMYQTAVVFRKPEARTA